MLGEAEILKLQIPEKLSIDYRKYELFYVYFDKELDLNFNSV